MTSFWRLGTTCAWEGWEWRYVLFMVFPVFWILLMSSEICNNTTNEDLSHYFSNKKQFTLGKEKIWKYVLLNDYVIKNNTDIIILITWLMLKFLLKSKGVLYQVLSDLGEVKCFCGPKSPPPAFQKFKKACLV